MPVSPLNPVGDDKEDPRGVLRVQYSDTHSESDPGRLSQHSRTTSNNTLPTLDAPPTPISPRHVRTLPIRRNSSSVGDIGEFSRWSTGYGHNPDSPRRETFSSPKMRPMTMYSIVQSSIKIERERAKSTMLTHDTVIPKPWTSRPEPYQRFSYFLTYAMIVLGFMLSGVRVFLGWRDVRLLKGNLCLVMDENFDSDAGIFGDNGTFFREVEMSGFGYFFLLLTSVLFLTYALDRNGQFEMTTSSGNNSYVKNGHLYITPTLTSDAIGEAAIIDAYVYNITGCTYNITKGITYTSSSPTTGSSWSDQAAAYLQACSAVSNVTSGQVINPVQSARLSTRNSASIKYGKVEVRARNPTG